MRRNSLFKGLSDRRPEAIQRETLDVVASRHPKLASRQAIENERLT
jgi:hypothetical protein